MHMLTAISGIADRRELAKHAFGVGSLLCEAAAPKGIRAWKLLPSFEIASASPCAVPNSTMSAVSFWPYIMMRFRLPDFMPLSGLPLGEANKTRGKW
jgi:hypothetical protein